MHKKASTHISDVFIDGVTLCSFEFFPPKSKKAAENLYQEIAALEDLKPAFVSVTYGAGGTTRELTNELVTRIHTQTSLDPIPHLTCVCQQESDIQEILQQYASLGVGNLLALGGDPPKGKADWDRSNDAFRYAADLVAYIKKFNDSGVHPDARGFGIGVAGFPEGHPGTPNRLQELDYLKAKVDAGADYIVTQLFFDNRDFYDFRERCELAGIHVPIIAGIMPCTSASNIHRMAELAAGARFPARLLRDLKRCQDDPEAVRSIGIHHATEQCRDLIHNKAAGIHFYTLNKSHETFSIYKSLGMKDSAALR